MWRGDIWGGVGSPPEYRVTACWNTVSHTKCVLHVAQLPEFCGTNMPQNGNLWKINVLGKGKPMDTSLCLASTAARSATGHCLRQAMASPSAESAHASSTLGVSGRRWVSLGGVGCGWAALGAFVTQSLHAILAHNPGTPSCHTIWSKECTQRLDHNLL